MEQHVEQQVRFAERKKKERAVLIFFNNENIPFEF